MVKEHRFPMGALEVVCRSSGGIWNEAIRALLDTYDIASPPAARRRLTLTLTLDTPPYAAAELQGDWGDAAFLPTLDGTYEANGYFWRGLLEGFETGDGMVATFAIREEIEGLTHAVNSLRGILACATSAALVHEESLLLHACAMVHPSGEHAALFLGPSGAGKSTMTRRLPGWASLGDESVIVDLSSETPRVSGTLIPGKERLPRTSASFPLSTVFTLSPGADELATVPLGGGEAFIAWMERIHWYLPRGPLVDRVVTLVQEVSQRVPIYRLESNLSHDVASTLTAGS